MHMNQSVKIIVSIIIVAAGLYGAYIFSTSTPNDVTVETGTGTSTIPTSATSTATSTTQTQTKKPASPTKVTTSNTLVSISYRGGSCPNGKLCSTTKTITKDAVYFKDGKRVSNINKNDVARIAQSANTVNWTTLRSKSKTGCDLLRTQEITYTFYTNKGMQTISTCQYDFDITQDPFRTIAITLPQ